MFCPCAGANCQRRDDTKVSRTMSDTIPQNIPQKQCTVCLQAFPATPEFFHRSKLGKYGLRGKCKKCVKKPTPQTPPPDKDAILYKDVPQRKCTACLVFLPATPAFFFRSKNGTHGLNSVCKQCHKEGKSPVKLQLPEGHKRCHKCHQILPYESFGNCRDSKDGLQGHCKPCCRVYEIQIMTPERKRIKILRKYGITPNQYDQMLIAQGGVCACCGEPETYRAPGSNRTAPLSVDHDHKTGEVRALLCRRCNAAYGNLKEDPKRIRSLLRYAKRWQTKETTPSSANADIIQLPLLA